MVIGWPSHTRYRAWAVDDPASGMTGANGSTVAASSRGRGSGSGVVPVAGFSPRSDSPIITGQVLLSWWQACVLPALVCGTGAGTHRGRPAGVPHTGG